MGGKGSGGNNRLPTAIKKLRGNPGGRKLNEKEPKPEAKKIKGYVAFWKGVKVEG